MMIGQLISHYKITAKLGAGGMGVVYKAEDTRLERPVAIKILPHQIASQPNVRERFKMEAKAAAALNHPNIATIYSIEEVKTPEGNEEIFIVMEYIDGRELREIIQSEIPNPQSAIEYAVQIAAGLQAAHEKGIIHRDIKPANIMVTAKGQVKIMDFGLAKMASANQLTQAGTTLGTISYMSPEQTRGDAVDQRTDIWSFGVMLYEMIAGLLPFKGHYEQATMYAIMNEEPEPLNSLRPDVPPKLEQIVNKALAKDPDQRYQNLGEMLEEFKNIDKVVEINAGLHPETEAAEEDAPTTTPSSQAAPGKDNPRLNLKKMLLIGIFPFTLIVILAVLYFSKQPGVSQSPVDSQSDQTQLESPQPLATPQTPEIKPEASQSSAASQNFRHQSPPPQPGESQNSPGQPDITPEVKNAPVTGEHSALMMELSEIVDTGVLMQRLNGYKQTMQLAVGKKSDFESVEGCYVFVVDQDHVNEVFQFAGNAYHSLRSDETLSDLKEKYSGKTSVWVRDLSK